MSVLILSKAEVIEEYYEKPTDDDGCIFDMDISDSIQVKNPKLIQSNIIDQSDE